MEEFTVELEKSLKVSGYRCHTVVVGSGAAGLNCAERLLEAGIKDVILLTSNLYGGTSFCSGSDKQTYYKLSVFGDTPDSPLEMARAFFEGGGMDGDMAYIESLYSLPAFYRLVENGVPFPFNDYGAFVGYKTDHDPRQRATSAGPKTSRYMVETLLKKVRENKLDVFDRTTVVKLVTLGAGKRKKVCGLVALDERGAGQQDLGVKLFQAENIVLATGGPGELYASTVYPKGQVSLHGVALKAGAAAVNLGESQFGITSTGFRWNLSGTYQQVIPSYFSRDKRGKRINFLEWYYRSLPEMASNIFLKGYQWPFNAGRVDNFGSSLIDIAVEEERGEGNRTFLDFTRNPFCQKKVFNINSLFPEARQYLQKSSALQKTPYQRLARINPESIEIYREAAVDLKEPLEIAVSFQHNNGGLAVDSSWQTEIKNLFAIGELAGTHGVSRPGGAALNSGQVGGIRVVQYLISRKGNLREEIPRSIFKEAGLAVLKESRMMLLSSGPDHRNVRDYIQRQITDSAGFIRQPELISSARQKAENIFRESEKSLPKACNRQELSRAWETRNLVFTCLAFLNSIDFYIMNGGGSRGSYLVSEKKGNHGRKFGKVICEKGLVFFYRKERLTDRFFKIKISGPDLNVFKEPVRPLPKDKSWFETVWRKRKKNEVSNPASVGGA